MKINNGKYKLNYQHLNVKMRRPCVLLKLKLESNNFILSIGKIVFYF